MDHSAILEEAFADSRCTPATFPAADVNQKIHDMYETDESFVYTASQLWDMEIKKAYNPEKYLPRAVRPGSLKVFGVTKEGTKELFVRVTDQRMWKDPEQYSTVIEQVCVEPEARRVVFIGVPEAQNPDSGEKIVAGRGQPPFHVEHAVVGSEERPLNTWRIVHLTEERDAELERIFDQMGKVPFLTQYNEVYVREDMGKKLVAKELK